MKQNPILITGGDRHNRQPNRQPFNRAGTQGAYCEPEKGRAC